MTNRGRCGLSLILAGLVVSAAYAQSGSPSQMVRSEFAFPTGNRTTSVILLERSTPAEVRAGESYEYILRVSNLTRIEVGDVRISEQVSDNFTVGDISPSPLESNGGMITWQFASLAPGESKEIRVSGSTSQTNDITYCASVTYETVACAVTKVVAPALKLVKTATPQVTVCDPIQVKLVVTNSGTGVARNVVVTDDLPEGWATTDGRSDLSFNAGDLNAGQSREFTFAAKSSRKGQFVNNAKATEAGGLSAEDSASTVVTQPELELVKTAPAYRYVGRSADFTLTVRNTGDSAARDTVIVDTVPNGTQFVSASDGGQASGNRVTWNIGELAPGAERTVTLKVKLMQLGEVCNSATARAYCADAQAQTCMEVRGIPAILLEVIDLDDPIEVGSTTTYVITVVNQGSATGTNIRVDCTLPPEQDYVSADGPTAVNASGKSVSFAPLPQLAAKAKATYRVVVRGTAANDVRFKVSMQSDQTTSPVEETESTNVY